MINMVHFDENAAKLILEKNAFNNSIEFINADRPDLQNDNFGIGIEVTQAVDPKEAEINSLYSKYKDPNDSFFANEMSDEEKKTQKKRKQWLIENGITNSDIPLLRSTNFTKGIESPAYDVFYNAVKTKLGKLNEGGYKIYPSNYLFVFTDLLIEENWCPALLKQLFDLSKNFTIQYSKIYVLFITRFVCFNIIDNTYTYQIIPNATINQIYSDAYLNVSKSD